MDLFSLVVLVSNFDTSVWLCVNFRKVYMVFKFDTYPMPHIDEVNQLGMAYFTQHWI